MSEYSVTGLVNGSGLIYQGKGAVAVPQYSLVYLSGSNLWSLVDSDLPATTITLGIAVEPLSVNQLGKIMLQGLVANNAWTWTPGGLIYNSSVAGGLTQTAPTSNVKAVGYAVTATVMSFDPASAGVYSSPEFEFSPESEASYVVWVDGGVYYAKNGHTGAVTSNANSTTLISSITSSLVHGDTLIFKGNLIIPTKITITGINNLTWINQGTITLDDNGVGQMSMFAFSNCDNLKVIGGKYDMNKAANTNLGLIGSQSPLNFGGCDGLLIQNLVATNGFDGLILGGSCTDVKIINCDFINSDEKGIYFSTGTNNVLIKGNYLYDINDGVIKARLDCKNWIIEDNYIDNNGTGWGIFLEEGHDGAEILNNVFINEGGGGFLSISGTGTGATLNKNIHVIGGKYTQSVNTYPFSSLANIDSKTITLESATLYGFGTITDGWGSIKNCNIFQSSDSGQAIYTQTVDCEIIGNHIETDTVMTNGIMNYRGNNIRIMDNIIIGANITNAIQLNLSSNTGIQVYNNRLQCVASIYFSSLAGTNSYSIHNNIGYVTENSGTATIIAAATSIAVTHGLSYTPSALDVSVVLTNLPTTPIGDIYVDTFTSTQFTIHCTSVPGVATAIFAWHVNKTP